MVISQFRNALLSLADRENERIRKEINDTGADRIPLKGNKRRSLTKTAAYFIAGILFFIMMWWIVSEIYNTYFMYSLRFPTPSMVFSRLDYMFFGDFKIGNNTIYTHIESSLKRWISGFIVGFSIGLILGVILSSNSKLYEFGMVPVGIWQMIPSLAWLPVTILLFGFGNTSAIFIISASVVAPITINIANGLKRVPPVYIKLSNMSEKTWGIRTLRVTLPYAALDVVTGLRIGMANGWRTLISAEMVIGVMIGLGWTINAATGLSSYTTAFACIMIICAIGIVIDRIILANIEKIVRKKMGLEDL
jgi:ABC-type nitrate/sulfonate/bicarbonate transport system, permease component